MNNTKYCRICLAVDKRLCVISEPQLQNVYRKLVDLPLDTSVSKLVACYICHSELRRCQQLARRAVIAQELLNNLLQSDVTVKKETLKLIDRDEHSLTYSHSITDIEVWPHLSETEEFDSNLALYTVKDDDKIDINVKLEENGSGDAEKDVVEDVKETLSVDYADDFHQGENSFDSEDELPLKDIAPARKTNELKEKKTTRKTKIEATKKKNDLIMDAVEIFLTKDQQMAALLERSKSSNYINSPLKCELCYKGFVDTQAFSNHQLKHDKSRGAWQCGVCGVRFAAARAMRAHAARHATMYRCNKCGETLHTRHQAREHDKWHNGHTYDCQLCGDTFKKPTSYFSHVRKRHPSGHVCSLCGEQYVSQHGLQVHRTKAHAHEETKVNTEGKFCKECNIDFATLDAWKRHILKSAKHTVFSENKLHCEICEKTLPTSTEYAEHLREHERSLRIRGVSVLKPPRMKHECEQCGKVFDFHSKMQEHIRRVHLGIKYNKNIVCEVCGKKCRNNSALAVHQRRHSGERPFACACGRRFASRARARLHARVHSGERPHACALCGKAFTQKPALNRHYRVHTGVKPYTCEVCNKSFSQSNSLKLHVRAVHCKLPRDKPAASIVP